MVDLPNKYVLQFLKIAFIIANSVDPDEMQITKLPFLGFQYTKGVIQSSYAHRAKSGPSNVKADIGKT